MCQKCVAAVRLYYPDCPDDKMGDFLISATAFPCGDGDIIERQLKEHKEAGCATWEEACVRADEQMDKAMREAEKGDK